MRFLADKQCQAGCDKGRTLTRTGMLARNERDEENLRMNKFPTLFTFTYFHSLAGYCFVLQIFLLRRGVYLNLDSDNTLDLPNQPIFCHGYKQYLGVGGAGWLVCCSVPVLGNGNFISQGLFFYICPAFCVCIYRDTRIYGDW